MFKFINIKTGENMDHIDFVNMVWNMSEYRYEKCVGKLWCNLNAYEQNQCYCIQFEDLINSGWRMFPSEWKFEKEEC